MKQEGTAGSTDQAGSNKSQVGKRGWGRRFLNMLLFVDLPIRRKFVLFAFGTWFWFLFMAMVGVVSLSALHYNYHQVAENVVPYRQAIQTIVAELITLQQELARIAAGKPSDTGDLNVLRKHTRSIREEVAGLGLQNSEIQQAGTIVEQILQAMAKSNSEGQRYLREILESAERIDGGLEQLIARRPRAAGTGAAADDEAGRLLSHLNQQISSALTLSTDHIGYIDGRYRIVNNRIYDVIRNSVHGILLALILASTLLFLFVRQIIAAFQQPIERIISQIEALSSGNISAAQKVTIISRDEIGTLSRRLNELIDTVYGMTVFKKVIEEDTSLDEVYHRLGEVFAGELAIERYAIYEVNTGKKEMRVAYPPQVGEARRYCHEEILNDCTLCRAVKTGHNISSFDYEKICRQFTGEEGLGHVCIPLMLGGNTGGVVQFVFAVGEGARPALTEEAARNLFKAETYLNQSLSVIEAKRLMNTLRDSAMVDPMTGLYNRRFLQEHSKQIISGVLRRGKQIALLVCDIDYFKQVNDTHGHDVGDMILKELSVILKNSVRDSDVVVRFGGEEFLVLLLDVEPGDGMEVAEKIRARVQEMKVTAGTAVLQKTISIGVSEFPADTDGLWQAIKYADVALYQAKESGRNRVVRFSREMWPQEDF